VIKGLRCDKSGDPIALSGRSPFDMAQMGHDASKQSGDNNASQNCTRARRDTALTAPAFADSHMGKDIVDTAVEAGSFTTLVAAVQAAGLVETLKAKARSPSSRRPTTPSPPCPRAPSRPCCCPRTRIS
jgi:hypothetical protein